MLNMLVPGSGDLIKLGIDLIHRRRLLLRWHHGLGDTVQGTILLRHLRHFYPRMLIDCAVKPGCNVFYKLAHRVFLLGQEPSKYDYKLDLPWLDPSVTYADSPSTKAERCLRETFGIVPMEPLCRYVIHPDRRARKRARRFSDIGPFCLVHYEGNSAAAWKNMTHATMAAVVDVIRSAGLTPVLLDWDERSPLRTEPGVVNPGAGHWLWGGQHRTGDGATIAALAALSTLNIGIDSGPGHIFGAVETPAIISWRDFHPVQYYCLAENVLHVVRRDHSDRIIGDRASGLAYFRAHYRYEEIDSFRRELPRIVAAELEKRGHPHDDRQRRPDIDHGR